MADTSNLLWVQTPTCETANMEPLNLDAHGSIFHSVLSPNMLTQMSSSMHPLPTWYIPSTGNLICAQLPYDIDPSGQSCDTITEPVGIETIHRESKAPDTLISSPTQPESFICKWENCTSTHVFRREIDLMRHVKTIHVAPQAFPCHVGLCGRAFPRKDKLRDHMARVHQVNLA
ncbi:hypothetical protein BJX65DRAFT_27363 [Aspergillus insuetus]